MQYLGTTSRTTACLGSFPRQTIQHHSHPSLCPNCWCWRSCSWTVMWRPTRPSRTNSKKTKKKRSFFHYRGRKAKERSQDIPGVTGKFGLGLQNEAGQRLTELCQENALVVANTNFQQHKRQLYTRTSPNGQYWNQTDYRLIILFAAENGDAIYSQKKQYMELTVAQITSSFMQNSGLNWENN